ncbi:MAG: glycosyltransferase [Prevotellaceae bacterium]|jgi:glycosyltransferase involved in cell wall biosynthesis|nr:glycosyltransferase [Prevotellaceae bacterium]
MSFDFLNSIRWDAIPTYIYALYGVLVLCTLVQLYYYLVHFGRVLRFSANPDERKDGVQLPVSIVICAKNEQRNLKKNLPLFLQQDYPHFEVVVVNDGSTDESEMLLYDLKQHHSNLQITTIEQDRKFVHDRKLAITVGIKAAHYDNIVFTEPDCAPPSNRWLATLSGAFGEGGEVVVSYCCNRQRRGIAGKIMRADSVFSALFSLHAAIKGKPYRSAIKNMGISQALFFRSKGFARCNAYPQSEETLFLCRSANRKNTRVALSRDAILSSSQQLTFGQWFQQKCIYASLVSMGKRGKKHLRAEMISRALFFLCIAAFIGIAALRHAYLPLAAAAPLLIVRFVAKAVVLSKAAKKLQERGAAAWLLLYDIFSPILAVITSLAQPNLHRIKKIK